jgi:PHS family inorganic phosphate transporter-like MFS transporter
MSDSHSSDIQGTKEPNTYSLAQERRAALEQIDKARFNRFHIKVCFVAGVGFFTDAYDLFAINIASTMLGNVYGPVGRSQGGALPATGATLTPNQDLGLKVAGPVGNLFGQVLFGWLADIVGRKRMYGVELCIIIVATFAQAISGHAAAISIIGVLVLWRFIMGVGIGGDYPLSAVISSEFASTRTRGRLMTGVFSSQGWGQFTAAVVGAICVAAFKGPISADPVNNPIHVDYVWRLIIGIGCVPGAIALYFRLTIPETPRFTMDIERNIRQAAQDVDTFLTTGTFVVDVDAVVKRAEAPKASRRDFSNYFGKWENLKVLIGTAYSWFALDIAFYGLGLNNSIILQTIGFGTPTSDLHGGRAIYQNLLNTCIGNMILSVAGLIPGYYFSMIFIDSWGRKPIQLMGFIMLTIIFIIMGFGYDAILAGNKGSFVFLYCLANFFQNFGPNTTTFIVPGEAFPTRYRSTGHGISAASGKLGAVVAQVGFARLKDIGGKNKFIKHILEIFALFMLTGIFSTLLIPETKQRSLEDISNEDQDTFIKGIAGRHTDVERAS